MQLFLVSQFSSGFLLLAMREGKKNVNTKEIAPIAIATISTCQAKYQSR